MQNHFCNKNQLRNFRMALTFSHSDNSCSHTAYLLLLCMLKETPVFSNLKSKVIPCYRLQEWNCSCVRGGHLMLWTFFYQEKLFFIQYVLAITNSYKENVDTKLGQKQKKYPIVSKSWSNMSPALQIQALMLAHLLFPLWWMSVVSPFLMCIRYWWEPGKTLGENGRLLIIGWSSLSWMSALAVLTGRKRFKVFHQWHWVTSDNANEFCWILLQFRHLGWLPVQHMAKKEKRSVFWLPWHSTNRMCLWRPLLSCSGLLGSPDQYQGQKVVNNELTGSASTRVLAYQILWTV